MKSEAFLKRKFGLLSQEFELANIKAYSSDQLHNVKKKQLVNAAKIIGEETDQSVVVGVLDTTIFGSGKEGALFTGKWVFIRGAFGSIQGKIDLSKLTDIEYEANTRVSNGGRESKEYCLIWKYQDNVQRLTSDNKVDGNLLACIEKILDGFSENVGNKNVEETNNGQTLVNLDDDAKSQYLKIIFIYLNDNDELTDRDMRNYAVLQSQLNVSSTVDEQLREYRFESPQEDIESQIEKLKRLIPAGSQETILQALINDILSTFNTEELDNWESNHKFKKLVRLSGVPADQVTFYVRNRQLNLRQLNEKLTDKDVKDLAKKILPAGATATASVAALAITGASVGAFGELGLGTLAFATMSTGGLGLAVLGIGAAGAAAYKGTEWLTNPQQEKYAIRNELLEKEILKLSNSQQILMKDINYITDKVSAEISKNESNEEKLRKAEKWINKVRERSILSKKIDEEQIGVQREQFLTKIPEKINQEKLHDLVRGHALGNEIEEQVLDHYDEDNNLKGSQSLGELSKLFNYLSSLEYSKTMTVANAKVAGKTVKGASDRAAKMATSFIKGHINDEIKK